MKTVNYDKVADRFDKRYETAYRHQGVASTLRDLIGAVNAQRVLEVGCGTGHWLDVLRNDTRVVGMDLSHAMLQKAASSHPELALVRGEAGSLPFAEQTFGAVFCVNALHHFTDPSAFIAEAFRLLTTNGVLAVIGMNPHTGKDRWFIYDYFPGTYELDLQRYPSPGTIITWMRGAGFEQTTEQVAERLQDDKSAHDVLPLSKEFTSQLSLLSAAEYDKGIAKIETAMCEARDAGNDIVFPVDVSLCMVKGYAVKQERS